MQDDEVQFIYELDDSYDDSDATLEGQLRSSLNISRPEKVAIALPPITPHMEDVINSCLTGREDDEVLVHKFSIRVTRRDIKTLNGLNWLNDEVINFYFNLIHERSLAVQAKDPWKKRNWPSVYVYNTFFFKKLLDSGYNSVRRWTRSVDIFKHDLLLIPIHLGVHWCLASVDLRKPGIFYYDSMRGDNIECLDVLLSYLKDEYANKKQETLNTGPFQTVIEKDIPLQLNGSDCGMFTLKFAEYLSRDAPFHFSQEDMPYFRQRLIYEIINTNIMFP